MTTYMRLLVPVLADLNLGTDGHDAAMLQFAPCELGADDLDSPHVLLMNVPNHFELTGGGAGIMQIRQTQSLLEALVATGVSLRVAVTLNLDTGAQAAGTAVALSTDTVSLSNSAGTLHVLRQRIVSVQIGGLHNDDDTLPRPECQHLVMTFVSSMDAALFSNSQPAVRFHTTEPAFRVQVSHTLVRQQRLLISSFDLFNYSGVTLNVRSVKFTESRMQRRTSDVLARDDDDDHLHTSEPPPSPWFGAAEYTTMSTLVAPMPSVRSQSLIPGFEPGASLRWHVTETPLKRHICNVYSVVAATREQLAARPPAGDAAPLRAHKSKCMDYAHEPGSFLFTGECRLSSRHRGWLDAWGAGPGIRIDCGLSCATTYDEHIDDQLGVHFVLVCFNAPMLTDDHRKLCMLAPPDALGQAASVFRVQPEASPVLSQLVSEFRKHNRKLLGSVAVFTATRGARAIETDGDAPVLVCYRLKTA